MYHRITNNPLPVYSSTLLNNQIVSCNSSQFDKIQQTAATFKVQSRPHQSHYLLNKCYANFFIPWSIRHGDRTLPLNRIEVKNWNPKTKIVSRNDFGFASIPKLTCPRFPSKYFSLSHRGKKFRRSDKWRNRIFIRIHIVSTV